MQVCAGLFVCQWPCSVAEFFFLSLSVLWLAAELTTNACMPTAITIDDDRIIGFCSLSLDLQCHQGMQQQQQWEEQLLVEQQISESLLT